MAGKIANFFKCVDGPLPICWTPLADPPRKKPKCSQEKYQKIQQLVQVVIDSDNKQSE